MADRTREVGVAIGAVATQAHLGLPALDARSRELYGKALPRGVLLPRFVPDRPPRQLLDAARMS